MMPGARPALSMSSQPGPCLTVHMTMVLTSTPPQQHNVKSTRSQFCQVQAVVKGKSPASGSNAMARPGGNLVELKRKFLGEDR